MLAGILVSIPLARNSVPLYPQDLVSYIGGFYASEDGHSPYNTEASRASLRARGIEVEAVYDYVYPPPFLLILKPLAVLPYRLYRMLWIGASILAVWGGAWLLAMRLGGRSALLFAALSAIFLLLSRPMHDCLYWGQVSCFVFAAVSVQVYARFKGAAAGAAAALHPMLKIGFVPLMVFLKGRKAWIYLLVGVLVLGLLGGAIFGFDAYAGWVGQIQRIGRTWDMDVKNNLSFGSVIRRVAEQASISDEQRLAARGDDQKRMDLIARVTQRTRLVQNSIMLLVAGAVVARLLMILRAGHRPGRYYMLALVCLGTLALLPYVWIHYALVMLIPLWFILSSGMRNQALLLWATMMLYGLPLSDALGAWSQMPGLRSAVPLGWLAWLLARGDPGLQGSIGRSETHG
ncbi:MAG: glycosyltransferase family 87 protein, partial [Candidatus Fermentibacterota bacterium]